MDPTRLMTMTGSLVELGTATSDEYGNVVDTDAASASVACYLHQLSADEITVDANLQTGDYGLFLPPDTATNPARITVDGDIYEFIGPVDNAFNPRLHRYTHQRATVRRVA